jgi:3-oxoacyl-[acyl-carrier-protein] synthase III
MLDAPLHHVRIAGIAPAVPAQEADPAGPIAAFGAEDVEKILSLTGTRKRRKAEQILPRMCVSDMVAAAAPPLLQALGWELATIDALIFVTQAPDYRLPATSCILQARLGLPKSCAAFDVNLGCSGWVYGMWLASTMIASGSAKRVLLAVGDESPFTSPLDRSTALLRMLSPSGSPLAPMDAATKT